MAGKRRRRNYTYMSETPRTTQVDNHTQDDNTEPSSESPPVPINSQTNEQPTQFVQGQSQATSSSTPLESSGLGSNVTNATRKKGRGPALGYQGKERLQLVFNEYMQPIGDTSTDLSNILGEIARCGARAPLDVVSWTLMPTTNLDIMWRDVQHKTDAPEAFKPICLKLIGSYWKKWKSRVKSNHFTPYKDDPIKLLSPPADSRIDPNKWPALVEYWQREDVEAQSARNSSNRKHLEFLPRTGRTSHANIREEMKANNEDISRAKVFIKTRTRNDGTVLDDDTRKLIDRMKEKLTEVSESEQSETLKEKVFTDLLGPDGHGRVRTMGVGPSPRVVVGPRSPSMNIYSSDAIQRMVRSQVEAQVAEKVSDYEKVQREMSEKMDFMERLLLREGLLEPTQLHDTPRSGSSVGQVQTTSDES